MSLSPDEYVCRGKLEPFETLSIFAVFDMATAAPNTMSGWELSVTFNTSDILVLERQLLDESASDAGLGDDNWIVSLAEPVEFAMARFAVLEYRVTLVRELENIYIQIAPSDPSSAPWFPAPVWLTSEADPRSVTFDNGAWELDRPGYPWSYVLLNENNYPYTVHCPGPVSTVESSFGALKSRYAQ